MSNHRAAEHGRRLNVTSDVDQESGILGGRGSGSEDARIASEFLFLASTSRKPPDEWMEPINGLGGYPKERYPEIQAAHMCEFVEQCQPHIVGRPAGRLAG